MSHDGYISARHAAEFLDLTVTAFDQAVRRHGIPHTRLGRLRRFLKSDLVAAMAAMSARPKPKRKAVAA